jgi:hypothetical protein
MLLAHFCIRIAIASLLGTILLLQTKPLSKSQPKSFRHQLFGVWNFKANVQGDSSEREWDLDFNSHGDITLYRKPLVMNDPCKDTFDPFACRAINTGLPRPHYYGWAIVKKGCYRILASNQVSIQFAPTADRFDDPKWRKNCGNNALNYKAAIRDSKLILTFLPGWGEVFDGKVMVRPW